MRLCAILVLSLAAVTMSSAQSSKQIFPGANAAMPFAAAVKADGLIYVSGTLGSGGDVKAQTKQVLDTISATLKTAGSSLANAASVTVYLRNQADFAAMNKVYRGYWTADPPARTTVMVPLTTKGSSRSPSSPSPTAATASSSTRPAGRRRRIPTATASRPATRCSRLGSSRATARTTRRSKAT